MVGFIHEHQEREAVMSVESTSMVGRTPLKVKGISLEEASTVTMETVPTNMSMSTASPFSTNMSISTASPFRHERMANWAPDVTADANSLPWSSPGSSVSQSRAYNFMTHRLSSAHTPHSKRSRYQMQRPYNPASATSPTQSSLSKQHKSPSSLPTVPASPSGKSPHPGWKYSDYKRSTESWLQKTHSPREDPACPYLVSSHTEYTPNGKYSLYRGDRFWKPFPRSTSF